MTGILAQDTETMNNMIDTLNATREIEKLIVIYETRAEFYKTMQTMNEFMVRDLKALKEVIKKNG